MSTNIRLKRSSVKGKAPTTSNIELGEIAINTNDGRLFFKTTDSSSTSAIVTLREISGGTGITETQGELSITDTGVVSGSYGSATEIPILSINAQGQIDSASTVTVAGVSGLAYDSGSNLLTLSTADGGSYSVKIDLNTFTDSDTTDDLPEGSTNQYFTNARVQTHLGAVTGSIIPDTDSAYDLGSSDKKFRDLYLSNNTIYLGNAKLSFDSANNQLVINNTAQPDVTLTYDLGNNTTDDLPQGSTNLYYDSDRTITTARHAISATGNLSYNATTGVISYTDVPYAGFDSDFSQKTTNDLTEGGSNLYFTNARARQAVNFVDNGGFGSFSYDTGTGVFAYTGVSTTDIRNQFSAGPGISISGGGVISSTITQYTDALARGTISVNDTGGDGSLSYDSSTGIFTYTGPSASEVRAHFSAGTGIGITNGQISTSITQYTDADARGAVSASTTGTGYGNLTYDESSGVFTFSKVTTANIRDQFSEGAGISITNGEIQSTITQYTDDDARATVSVNDAGGDGSLSYDSDTGIFTYTGPSASEVRAHISAGGDLSYSSSTGVVSFTERTDQEVRNLFSSSGDLNYDSSTGQFSFTAGAVYTSTQFDSDLGTKTTDDLAEGTTNLYYDSATTQTNARNAISVTDAGGDGSLAYSASTGTITYTGPSASETRAHFSGGTGVTITNGSVAIGQSVGTTDDVIFGKITVDSAQVGCLHLTKQAVAPNSLAGLLYYDSDPQNGLSFKPTTNENVQDVTINLGQETLIYVHNLTGAQINNGQAVYISGVAHGAHPQVSLAKADNASTARPIGLATMDIPNGAHGYVTSHGLVRDVNTTGMTAGGTAYLSKDSAGEWATTEVSVDSGYPTHLGTVLTVGAQGTILVNVEAEHFEYLRVQDKIITHDLEAPDIYTSHMHFDGKDPGYYAEGLVYYDSGNGALVVKNDEQEVTLQIGQEEWIRVYNNSGSTITNGTPVYLSGTSNGLPSIVASDAVNGNGVNGVATHDIENGSVGYVTARGVVNDVNTQGISVGSKIHVAVGGGLTGNTIDYPNYPNDVGVCLVEDSAVGKIYVDIVDHTMETLRVTEDARFDQNVTIGGNLNVIGVTTEVLSQSLTTSGNLLQLLDGDTVGTAYQNTGGLNDATFKGKYTGDSDVFYFVRMVSVDSAGVGDTIEWGVSDSDQMLYGSLSGGYGYGAGFDSANGQTTWNLKTDGLTAPLRNGLSIQFINLSGHDSADVWCAHPTELNLDLGMIGNYNQQNEPLKYAGVVRDATDERWKFFDGYPAANVDSSSTQFDINFDSASLADIEFSTAYGNLSGNASSATTATQLASSRNFSLSGNVTSAAVGFNGTGNVTLSTSIANNVITNAMINSSAAIADSKLATISTAGKVQNSATTATSANTASAIVARDVTGNFSAGTITANLSGNVTGTVSSLSNHTSTIRGLFSVDNTLSYDSSTGQFSITNPGTDSATTHAIFSVDSSANTGDGSLTYNGAGVFTYKGPTAAETRAHFSGGTGITITNGSIATTITQYTDTDARDAISLSADNGISTLAYSNGAFTFHGADSADIRTVFSGGTGISINDSGEISTSITQYEDSDARSAISTNNTGTGYGSIGYNSGTGVINFNKVTDANIRSAISEGTGISISNGQISTTITQYADSDARSALSGGNTGTGFGSLAYNSGNGAFTFTKVTKANIRSALQAGTGITLDSSNGTIATTITQYTDSDAQAAISHTNTGTGFGSIGYNSGTGVINYNKVTKADIRSALQVSGDLSFDSSNGMLSFSETYSTAAELLTALKTVDTNSSGLNADTLDGEQGSHYRINVYNSSGTLLN